MEFSYLKGPMLIAFVVEKSGYALLQIQIQIQKCSLDSLM